MSLHTHGEKIPGLDGEERSRLELRSPYGPSPDETGVDKEFAANTLHIVRDGWEEMRAGNPDFYVGMAVCGSLVKGRAHEKSDVDGIIFYDPDSDYARSLPYREMLMRPNVDITRTILKRLELNGYADTFLSVGSYEKIAMNEQIVSEAIIDIGNAVERFGSDRVIDTGRDLSLLFSMRIGSGKLKRYRKQVLDELSQSRYGESIWSAIMDELERDEEQRRGAKIYLPHTISEAYRHFQLASNES